MYPIAEGLYRDHAAELTAALALSLDDRDAAADVAHEVFVQAMLREDQLRAHPDPRGWLFRTGYNLARNRLALLLRRRSAVAREHAALDARSWEDAIDLRDGLKRLSPRQRDAVVLHYYFGFSVLETADLLGIAEGSVLSHLYRGRKALNRILLPEEGNR